MSRHSHAWIVANVNVMGSGCWVQKQNNLQTRKNVVSLSHALIVANANVMRSYFGVLKVNKIVQSYESVASLSCMDCGKYDGDENWFLGLKHKQNLTYMRESVAPPSRVVRDKYESGEKWFLDSKNKWNCADMRKRRVTLTHRSWQM